MREILLRGKRVDNGEWIVGSLIIDERGNHYIGEYIRRRVESAYVCTKRGNGKTINRFIGIGFFMVIPETVGQYTGLTDKNGEKIFEGDIVRTLAPTSTDIYIEGVVMFGEYQTAFQSSNIGYYVNWSLNKNLAIYCKINDIEVIGNIHDNPELLKGE